MCDYCFDDYLDILDKDFKYEKSDIFRKKSKNNYKLLKKIINHIIINSSIDNYNLYQTKKILDFFKTFIEKSDYYLETYRKILPSAYDEIVKKNIIECIYYESKSTQLIKNIIDKFINHFEKLNIIYSMISQSRFNLNTNNNEITSTSYYYNDIDDLLLTKIREFDSLYNSEDLIEINIKDNEKSKINNFIIDYIDNINIFEENL